MNQIPEHIAVIMDGNRRWAENKKVDKIDGHKEGIETAKKIAIESHKIGTKNLTLYAFSFQNWNRPKIEVESLFQLFTDLFEDKSKFFKENGFVFNPIGRLDELSSLMKKKIFRLHENTMGNKGLIINVAINYGGQEEIVDTLKKISFAGIDLNSLDVDLLKKFSYLPKAPDPELIIRTGGHSRISNFLNLHNSYSEIIVSSKLWPDFTLEDFHLIIKEYKSINRNYGK
tara:strand:+ start:4233 stop:4919 length:687 start_codon:yes stop_codon:yes gene_type:complete